ncbi:MAG: fimbrial protein, partial [Curvibacter sp.]
ESPWFNKPELIEIIAANVAFGKQQRRVANFTMRVRMLRASEVKQRPAGTVAPAGQAAAVAPATPVKP